MNLILWRFLFIKGKSYLYSSSIITNQLVQWFILSYTWPKSFHLPLTGNFQYHLSVLCNLEQSFHSGYHNDSTTCVPWNSTEHSEPCCPAHAVLWSRAVESEPDVWTGAHCGSSYSQAIPCCVLFGDSSFLWLDPFSLYGSWLVRTTCLLLPHLQACS